MANPCKNFLRRKETYVNMQVCKVTIVQGINMQSKHHTVEPGGKHART
jgi:hypothetical protein